MLLAPSWKGLQHLLSILEKHSASIDMTCNAKKTKFMVFKPKQRAKVVADVFPQFIIINVWNVNITRCVKHGVQHKLHQVQKNKLIVTKYVQMSATGTNTSMFAVGQLRLQSATAPSRATYAVDSVTAHRCHELWSHTHVADWQTIAPDMWPPNSPDLILNLVDYTIWSVIQLDAAGNIL